jgi:hypothetical protein
MNTIVKDMAKEAGFVFWKDEEWGPGKGNIDWSSNYDVEFQKFVVILTDYYKQLLIDNGYDDAAEYL